MKVDAERAASGGSSLAAATALGAATSPTPCVAGPVDDERACLSPAAPAAPATVARASVNALAAVDPAPHRRRERRRAIPARAPRPRYTVRPVRTGAAAAGWLSTGPALPTWGADDSRSPVLALDLVVGIASPATVSADRTVAFSTADGPHGRVAGALVSLQARTAGTPLPASPSEETSATSAGDHGDALEP